MPMKVNHLNDKIFTISNVLTPEECERYINMTEQMGYAEAPVTTSRGPKMIPDFRNNERVMYDTPELAEEIWQKLKDYIPNYRNTNKQAVGLNERLRFYKYHPGQEFKEHMDGRYRRNQYESSLMTLLIYLNGDFTGGETTFRDATVVPETGLGLIFQHKVLHAGAPVIDGIKYVLRSDVMFRSV